MSTIQNPSPSNSVIPKQHNNNRGEANHRQITRSKAIRDLIIEKNVLYLKSPADISRELHIPKPTVKRIIDRYIELGTTEYRQMGGDLRSILKEEHRQAMIDIVDANNTITLAELQELVLEKFPEIKKISVSTLCRYLNKVVRMTLKRATPMEEKRNDERNLEEEKGVC